MTTSPDYHDEVKKNDKGIVKSLIKLYALLIRNPFDALILWITRRQG